MKKQLFLILLLTVTISPSATAQEKEVRFFNGYTLEAQKPCDDFKRPAVCFPETLTATVFDKRRVAIATINNVNHEHYHPFEVHGQKLFWVSRIGDSGKWSGKPGEWTDQLWVKTLGSDTATQLLAYRGVDFRASPDGKLIALIREEKLQIFDRQTKTTKVIEGGEDVELLAWSTDSSKLWIGLGVIGGWSKLGFFRNGKITWLPYEAGKRESLLEPDRGWLITSNAPINYDVESEAQFQKSNFLTDLSVTDVYSGKRAILAQAPVNYFGPSWDSEGFLQYSMKGKIFRLSKDQIAEKLK